ncbi:hypothetical protein VNI00_004188 [Paramarasmius palmivorus]|uniref:MYND-type domain-containing protein n=1 Tax=Paramarasmius palmivorus TaxID=297713 RepID=A0AAW0DNY9_9AGAR
MGNNYMIEDQLSTVLPGMTPDTLFDRAPFSNVIGDIALEAGTNADNDPHYQCRQHRTVDCNTCFNWAQLIATSLNSPAASNNRIPITSSRMEKLGLLAAMGVELSPNTRLPEHDIDKKLSIAIDSAQSLRKTINELPINPSSFPSWPTGGDRPSLADSVKRISFVERDTLMRAASQGRRPFRLYENAFMDLRQSIISLGRCFENGKRNVVIQDKDQHHAIYYRSARDKAQSSHVRRLLRKTYPKHPDEPRVQLVIGRDQWWSSTLEYYISTPEEQNLILMFLDQNAQRLAPNYRPARRTPESTFMISFLLPTGPVSQFDIGRLINYPGCVLCGKASTSRCSQCRSVEYCGADCQTFDWKEHRAMCNALKGGTWRPLPFSFQHHASTVHAANSRVPLEIITMNMHDSMTEEPRTVEFGIAPNVHADKTFMIKIQRPLDNNGTPGAMLIYDQLRSMMVYVNQNEDPRTYDEIMQEMGTQLKIYRWAKRTGDKEFSVCLDRAPVKVPSW